MTTETRTYRRMEKADAIQDIARLADWINLHLEHVGTKHSGHRQNPEDHSTRELLDARQSMIEALACLSPATTSEIRRCLADAV